MPNDEAYAHYDRTHHDDAPNWSPTLTADSLPVYFGFNAIATAPLVAPTPLLIVHGTHDVALLPEHARAAFDAALEPKHLVWIETDDHVQLCDQLPYVDEAVGHTVAARRAPRPLSDHAEILNLTSSLGL